MADAPARPRPGPPPLELAGHLAVLAGDQAFRVEFRNEIVVVDLPDLRAARALSRLVARPERRARLARLREVLDRAGLLLIVRVADREVGRLGGGLRPGRLAAWLGMDPMSINARAILKLITRGPSAAR